MRASVMVLGIMSVLGLIAATTSRAANSSGDGPQDAASDHHIAPRCNGSHSARGRGIGIDLDRVGHAYEGLTRAVARDLRTAGSNLSGTLDRAYDSGLPACLQGETRTVRYKSPVPVMLRGRTLAFIAARTTRLPPPVEGDPRAGVFVVRTPDLATLTTLADRLDRPVMLADGQLARALGVRCAPAWVRVAPSGGEGEVHEGR